MSDKHERPTGWRRPGDSQMHRQRRGRNLAILAVLVALFVLFFIITIVRVGGS